MLKIIFIKVVLALIVLLGIQAQALMPKTISYQGYLTDNNGTAIDNVAVVMTFSIYDAASGGSQFWTTTMDVTPVEGRFEVSLDTGLAFDQPYWLGVKVGSDDEMVERVAITGVGQTIRAGFADDIADGSVTGAMIGDGAITLQKLADTCAPGQVLRQTASGWICGSSPH